jgi:hypothetical protein
MHRFGIDCITFTACISLFLVRPPNLVAQSSAPAISGIVVEKSGAAIPFAYVFVKDGAATVAHADGQFRIASARTERIVIGVRRIGYAPLDTTIDLAPGSGQSLRLEMIRAARQIDTVVVNASHSEYDDYLDRSGYYQRLARRVDGTFLSVRDLEKRHSLNLTGVLRDVDGVRVVTWGGLKRKGDFVLGRGGLCALGLVVDGKRVEVDSPPLESFQPRIMSIMGSGTASGVGSGSAGRIESLDEMVNLMGVSGIEVYPSATSVPNGLQHHVRGCGLIVVWTRFQ